MKFSWFLSTGGVSPFYTIKDGIEGRSAAVVTLRKGGYSLGAYAGFNLSFDVDDNPDDVTRNRQLLLATLGLHEQDCAWPEQVHGNSVLAAHTPGEFKGADGLASSQPNLWIGILVADCVPVFVFDKELSVVGLAHAGRKGTAMGVTKGLIKLIKSDFHLKSHQLITALGPSIGPCCYELDRATTSQLPKHCIVERDGKAFFDLRKANVLHAFDEGISPENVVLPPACTCCQPGTFFSHRAHGGKTGRQIAITRPGGLRVTMKAGRSTRVIQT